MGNPFKSPKTPPPPEPVKMPEPTPVLEMDQTASDKARKKKIVEASKRSGRVSTILSEAGSDSLGG